LVETAKGRATRQRIIEAAALELRERGARATTLEGICVRSRTGKGQLFHLFPRGRSELMRAVAESESERVFTNQQPYLETLGSAESWRRWRDGTLQDFRDEGRSCPLALLIVELGAENTGTREVAEQLTARWQKSLVEGISRGQQLGDIDGKVDAEEAAAALVTAIQGGIVMLLATESAFHLESALNICLQRLITANLDLSRAQQTQSSS
jgi:AcrR family transcriptional regulator